MLAYFGPIHPAVKRRFAEEVEALAGRRQQKGAFANPRRLVVVLDTPGGVVEAVEKMVDVVRHNVARRAILAIDAALSECRNDTSLKAGSVNVAVGYVSAATLLPQILHRFQKKHLEIELTVVDCMVERIRAKLLSREADIGQGYEVFSDDTPAQFGKFIQAGIDKWVPLVKTSGASID